METGNVGERYIQPSRQTHGDRPDEFWTGSDFFEVSKESGSLHVRRVYRRRTSFLHSACRQDDVQRLPPPGHRAVSGANEETEDR